MSTSKTPFVLWKRPALRANSVFDEKTLNGDLTIALDDAVIQKINPGGANRSVRLPSASADTNGAMYYIQQVGSGSSQLFVTGTAGENAASLVELKKECSTTVICNGTKWTSLGVFSGSLDGTDIPAST